MLIFGLTFPSLILVMTKSFSPSWRVIRLFASYLIVFSLLQMAADYFHLGIVSKCLLLVLFGLLEASNLEHIINNNSNQNFIFIKYLFDPVFLKGSGLTKRFFFRLLGIQLLILSILFLLPAFNLGYSLALLVSSIVLLFIIPRSSVTQDWLQENWIVFNFRSLLFRGKQEKKSHLRKDVTLSHETISQLDQQYAQLRPQEPGVSKWLEQKPAQNILLIVIEGLGETHLRKGWLPKLAQRREENVSVKSFLNHQRNTNRGLYSLFSGKHPNLINQMAKPDLVAQYGKLDIGVAEVLNRQGYRSVYLQGAPSIFMYKDRFLPHLGFSEVIGEEKFPKDVPRIKWGVDDHELYKQAELKINELRTQSAPWFLSLLTVTTHHPIEAANKVLKNLEDGFRYADDELDQFLNKLEASGVLDSTLVIITSDETAGDGSHVLSENLGTMIMLMPQKLKKEIEVPFTQADVAFSLCDYTGISEHPFLGRSLFRNYETERPLFFASIFQQKAFAYVDQKLIIQHYSGKKEILALDKLDLNVKPQEVRDADPDSFKKLEQFVSSSDRGVECLTTPVILDLAELKPTGAELVKSDSFIKVGLKKGESVELKFTGENKHANVPVVVCWLIQDMKHKRSFKLNLIVLPESKDMYTKIFTSPGDSWYDLSFRVTAGSNQEWILKDLQVTHA